MPKYLVVKGWLGFGDRLEVLKMWIKYALDNKLSVYVDWTDSIWCHQSETFYSYFDIPSLPRLQSLDDIPNDAKIHPPYWQGRLKETMTDDHLKYSKEYGLHLGTVHTNINIPEHIDVIVASSGGNRTLFMESKFFADVFRVIHPKILERVKQRRIKYNLQNCIGVHIRGTDRKKNEVQFTRKIQWMTIGAVHSGALSNMPMIAVTDDKTGYEIWKRFFPRTIMLSEESFKYTNDKGNHNVSSDELTTSKDEMNIDMLVDFFTLASCNRIMTTYTDSRFYQEAVRLSPYVKRILGE